MKGWEITGSVWLRLQSSSDIGTVAPSIVAPDHDSDDGWNFMKLCPMLLQETFHVGPGWRFAWCCDWSFPYVPLPPPVGRLLSKLFLSAMPTTARSFLADTSVSSLFLKILFATDIPLRHFNIR